MVCFELPYWDWNLLLGKEWHHIRNAFTEVSKSRTLNFTILESRLFKKIPT